MACTAHRALVLAWLAQLMEHWLLLFWHGLHSSWGPGCFSHAHTPHPLPPCPAVLLLWHSLAAMHLHVSRQLTRRVMLISASRCLSASLAAWRGITMLNKDSRQQWPMLCRWGGGQGTGGGF